MFRNIAFIGAIVVATPALAQLAPGGRMVPEIGAAYGRPGQSGAEAGSSSPVKRPSRRQCESANFRSPPNCAAADRASQGKADLQVSETSNRPSHDRLGRSTAFLEAN